jgi:hypothetical protein
MLTSFEATEHANSGALSVPGFGTRLAVRLGILMLALGLSACGGGGSDSAVSLGVSVIVQGQPVGGLIVPGQLVHVSMLAGQSVELDANEPVEWTFTIGNSPLFGNGTTVFVAGLAITQTAVSPSRVVIDTAASGPFPAPVILNLTATSTIDAAQVAFVDLAID